MEEKLHLLIDNSSEETLEHMYSFFENSGYTDEFKLMLDEKYNNYQSDTTGDSRDDINAAVNDLLKR